MYAFGPFSLDADRRLLIRGGQVVPVTARAFDVLLALVERGGEIVDKQALLRTVWPDTIVEEANLSQQIFTLRKLLGHTEDQPYIANVPRRGYRFVAPVTRRDEGAESGPTVRISEDATAPLRLEIALDPSRRIAVGSGSALAITRDGALIAYVGSDGTTTHIYLRPLDRFEATPVPGTEGATNPFFSPDGRWLGFQSGRRMHKLSLDGGPAFAIVDVADLRGAAWTDDGTIVYAPGPTTGLWRVPDSGGPAAPLTILDFDGGERTHRWPHALPDGRVMFTIGTEGATSFDEASLAVSGKDGARHQLVLRYATDGRSIGDGRIVWARGGSLFAAPFDFERGRADGPAQIVQTGVFTSATGAAHFVSSTTGVLVHVPGQSQTLRRSLVTIDRRGVELARHISGDSLEEPRVAPRGDQAIVSLRGRSSDLWLYDFARGALGRLTFEGENFAAIWGPEEGTATFSSSSGGPSNLFLLRPDRSAPPQLLVASEFDKVAGGWSPDATTLVFTEYHPDTGADIWLLDRHAERVRAFIQTRFNEYAPVFSPDGRHVAYVTDESGRAEVVVVSYPDATGKRQLSTEGGTEPLWSSDGTELFYRNGDRLMRVDMSGGVAQPGVPTTLFEGRYVPGTVTLANYDVLRDGAGFLMVAADCPPLPAVLRVTVGWLRTRSRSYDSMP